MKLFYSRLSHCQLYNTLVDSVDLRSAISYLVSFKNYEILKVRANKHSIELFNNEVNIYIILLVGFENDEFIANKQRQNQYYVSLNLSIITMHEFKNIEIKYIDKFSIVFTAVSLSNNEKLIDLKTILNFDNM